MERQQRFESGDDTDKKTCIALCCHEGKEKKNLVGGQWTFLLLYHRQPIDCATVHSYRAFRFA